MLYSILDLFWAEQFKEAYLAINSKWKLFLTMHYEICNAE